MLKSGKEKRVQLAECRFLHNHRQESLVMPSDDGTGEIGAIAATVHEPATVHELLKNSPRKPAR
jgi:hypothetical protein